MRYLEKYAIGYTCFDGSFSTIIKNKKSVMFDNYTDAEKEMKNIQKNYKHRLEIKKM